MANGRCIFFQRLPSHLASKETRLAQARGILFLNGSQETPWIQFQILRFQYRLHLGIFFVVFLDFQSIEFDMDMMSHLKIETVRLRLESNHLPTNQRLL